MESGSGRTITLVPVSTQCLPPTFGVFPQPYNQGRLRNVVRPCDGMFGHSFHQGVYHCRLQVVTISTWTVAVKDGLDSINPRSIEFALETIEPEPQPSCIIVDQVLSVNCLKKLSSEILFLLRFYYLNSRAILHHIHDTSKTFLYLPQK